MSGEESAKSSNEPTVPGGLLAPWHVGQLPPPPAPGWRLWIGLLGPGVVLAGTSIGSGEWLFGPAVSAQYGATLMWLASISIILQVFCNLMMMRYTLYCGEPIIVGGLRSAPGPRFGSSSTRCWISRRSGRTTPPTPPFRWRPPCLAICREIDRSVSRAT